MRQNSFLIASKMFYEWLFMCLSVSLFHWWSVVVFAFVHFVFILLNFLPTISLNTEHKPTHTKLKCFFFLCAVKWWSHEKEELIFWALNVSVWVFECLLYCCNDSISVSEWSGGKCWLYYLLMCCCFNNNFFSMYIYMIWLYGLNELTSWSSSNNLLYISVKSI